MKKGYRDGQWTLNNESGEVIRLETHQNKRLIDVKEF